MNIMYRYIWVYGSMWLASFRFGMQQFHVSIPSKHPEFLAALALRFTLTFKYPFLYSYCFPPFRLSPHFLYSNFLLLFLRLWLVDRKIKKKFFFYKNLAFILLKFKFLKFFFFSFSLISSSVKQKVHFVN